MEVKNLTTHNTIRSAKSPEQRSENEKKNQKKVYINKTT